MLEQINSVLSGAAVPLLLIPCGLFFCFRLRFFWILHPARTLRPLLAPARRSGGIPPRRALALSLAGTLGVGNIVGVSAAIYWGGPGAVFWMLVSAIAASALKYAETVLALRHRRTLPGGRHVGGAPYYIRDLFGAAGLPRAGAVLGGLFALLCLGNSLCMGCVIQVNAAAGALAGAWGTDTRVTGAVFALLALFIASGGLKRISGAAAGLVPVMSAGFFLMSAAVLILRADALPNVVRLVFSDAFSGRSALGGVLGAVFSDALRHGVMRGLLTNEAGAGTSPLAHAAADAAPAEQGVLSIAEVTADTVILCSMTSAVILIGWDSAAVWGENSVMMTVSAYAAVLGSWAEQAISAAVVLFGFATVICQSFYGLECVSVLTRRSPRAEKAARAAFVPVFALTCFFGASVPPASVWGISDLTLGLMTLINVTALLLGRREVFAEAGVLHPPKAGLTRNGKKPAPQGDGGTVQT